MSYSDDENLAEIPKRTSRSRKRPALRTNIYTRDEEHEEDDIDLGGDDDDDDDDDDVDIDIDDDAVSEINTEDGSEQGDVGYGQDDSDNDDDDEDDDDDDDGLAVTLGAAVPASSDMMMVDKFVLIGTPDDPFGGSGVLDFDGVASSALKTITLPEPCRCRFVRAIEDTLLAISCLVELLPTNNVLEGLGRAKRGEYVAVQIERGDFKCINGGWIVKAAVEIHPVVEHRYLMALFTKVLGRARPPNPTTIQALAARCSKYNGAANGRPPKTIAAIVDAIGTYDVYKSKTMSVPVLISHKLDAYLAIEKKEVVAKCAKKHATFSEKTTTTSTTSTTTSSAAASTASRLPLPKPTAPEPIKNPVTAPEPEPVKNPVTAPVKKPVPAAAVGPGSKRVHDSVEWDDTTVDMASKGSASKRPRESAPFAGVVSKPAPGGSFTPVTVTVDGTTITGASITVSFKINSPADLERLVWHS
jgi:hypothetical protein